MERSRDGREFARRVVGLSLGGAVCGLMIVLVACGGGDDAAAEETSAQSEEASMGGETATTGATETGETGASEETTASSEGEPDESMASEGTTEAPAEGDTETEPADATDSTTAGDTDASRRSVRRGRAVYDRVCGTCHPGGDSDLGPRLIGKRLTISNMRRQIRNGSGRMKAIPPTKLPERFMDDLMAYLATLRAVRGGTPEG